MACEVEATRALPGASRRRAPRGGVMNCAQVKILGIPFRNQAFGASFVVTLWKNIWKNHAIVPGARMGGLMAQSNKNICFQARCVLDRASHILALLPFGLKDEASQ